MYRTSTDYNDRNGAPLSNENIRDSISRVILEEEEESHTVAVVTFNQTPITSNTQGENKNMILTSEKQNNSNALTETLKVLTMSNAGYYE